MTAHDIAALLRRCSFSFVNEKQLQEGISVALSREGVAHTREVALAPGDIVDFLVDRVGVEVKISASLAQLTRQASRYLQSDRIDELLIVTARMRHRLMLPTELCGKAITVVEVIRL